MSGSRYPRAMPLVPAALVTGLGTGLLRPAPGTWGSLPPTVLAGTMLAGGAPERTVAGAMVLIGAAFCGFCLLWGGDAEAAFGEKDPSSVNADEVAAQAWVIAALPWPMLAVGSEGCARGAVCGGLSWAGALVLATAFVAFRAADIFKPPPARQWQNLPGGAGILLDDLAAGIYAVGAAWVVALLLS